MLHVTLLMDFNVKEADIVIILDDLIKVLDHLELPHDNSIILIHTFADMVNRISCFVVGKFSHYVDSVLFGALIPQDVAVVQVLIVFVD